MRTDFWVRRRAPSAPVPPFVIVAVCLPTTFRNPISQTVHVRASLQAVCANGTPTALHVRSPFASVCVCERRRKKRKIAGKTGNSNGNGCKNTLDSVGAAPIFRLKSSNSIGSIQFSHSSSRFNATSSQQEQPRRGRGLHRWVAEFRCPLAGKHPFSLSRSVVDWPKATDTANVYTTGQTA